MPPSQQKPSPVRQPAHIPMYHKSRILIVDDHPMVREALMVRIEMEPDLEVCAEAETENDALEKIKHYQPDLVIVDISLRQGNGIELISKTTNISENIKFLVYSTYSEDLYADRAHRAGAMGYLNKQEPAEQVLRAIRTVLAGKTWEATPDAAVASRSVDESGPVQLLSNRELEVFQLLGQGKTSSEIAASMNISIHTVDSYREKLKRKLGVKNSAELQREAVRWFIEKT